MSNENEYLPLAKLIERGLQEGTVLSVHRDGPEYIWRDNVLTLKDNRSPVDFNPLQATITFRIVSVPPKKITFEAEIMNYGDYGCGVDLPDENPFVIGDRVIVTVEDKR